MATTGNRPYSSRPKTGRGRDWRNRRPGESSFDEPTPAERRRMDEEQSKPYRESYDAGRKAGQEAGGKGRKPAGGGRPRGGKRPSRRRRAVPGARSARTAARQLQAPVRAQLTSGLRIAGITLALVALYNILTTPGPEAFSGVLGGVSRALTWLSVPAPIPKR